MKSCHFQREVIMYTDKAKKLADTAVKKMVEKMVEIKL